MSAHRIDVELGAQLVEAQVTLSVSKLNDVLRIVIDQSNQHEEAIAELKKRLEERDKHAQELQAEIEKLKPGHEKLERLGAQVDKLNLALEKLRQDVANQLDQVKGKLTSRLDHVEEEIKAEQDARKKDMVVKAEQIAQTQVQVKDCARRLDEIRIPDLKPLERSVEGLTTMTNETKESVDTLERFNRMWSADNGKMKKILDNAEGLSVYDLAKAKVDYVHSLPPMLLQREMLQKELDDYRTETSNRLDGVDKTLTEKVDTWRLADVLKENDAKMHALQDTADLHNRRLNTVEAVPTKLAHLEAAIQQLSHGKADLTSLNLKADSSALHHLATNVSAVQDDVNDLYERLPKNSGGSSAKMAAPSQQRPSAAVGAMQPQLDELRKAIAALDSETRRLEDRKAERDDLTKLHEYVEGMEDRVRTVDTASDRQSGVAWSRPNSGHPKSQQRLNTGESADNAGSMGGASSLPPVRPQTGGSSRHRSAPMSPKQSNDAGVGGGVFFPIVTALTPLNPSEDGRNSQQPTPPRVGNSWHLGRSVCSVRDSGGVMTPASIAHHNASN